MFVVHVHVHVVVYYICFKYFWQVNNLKKLIKGVQDYYTEVIMQNMIWQVCRIGKFPLECKAYPTKVKKPT